MSDAPSPTADVPSPSSDDPSRLPALMLRVGLILGIPLLVLGALSLRPRPVDVLIHNGHDVPARVAIDDTLEAADLTVEPHGTLRVTLTKGGQHTLRWALDGEPAAELTASLTSPFAAARTTWVWDVGQGAGQLWIVHRGYGTAAAPPAEKLTLTGALTPVPAGVLPLLDAPFPEQIREPDGATGGVRAALWSDHHADRLAPRRARLYLDNRSRVELRLYAGDRLLGSAPPDRVFEAGFPSGVHALRAVEVGAGETVLAEHTLSAALEVPPRSGSPAWVWCPAGDAPRYLILHRSYGEWDAPVPPLEPWEPAERFFAVPAELVQALNAFPARLDVPPGQRGALVKALFTPEGAKTPDSARALGGGLEEQLLRRVMEQAPEGFLPSDD